MPAEPSSDVRCDVTISIVSLNTRGLLAACLRSVFASTGVTVEVHVVDNGSSDGSVDMVARDFRDVRLTATGSNRGFAAANNCAIRDADGRYVLLLNPDTVLPPQTLSEMVRFMDAHQSVGICGPDDPVRGRPISVVRLPVSDA